MGTLSLRDPLLGSEPLSNGSWKCNTQVCGLTDTGNLAAKAERAVATKKLTRAVVCCVVFMIIEVIGGIKAGSLAVLTDAVHLLSDVASFAISIFAVWAGGWEASPKHTFGFYRLEILGALVSLLIIWLITGGIVYEAIGRLLSGAVEIDGRLMFIIASLGLLVNVAMMFLLGHDHGHGHGHSHDHDHGEAHSHSHDHKHEPGEVHNHSHEHRCQGHGSNDSHPVHAHDHGEQSQGSDHSHHHEDPNTLVVLSTSPEAQPLLPSDGESQGSVGVDLKSHKQECVRHNFMVRGEDRRIVCICSEKEESPSESKVTIDHEGEVSGSNKGNINVRSAYLHVLGDLIQSIGVMVGGAIIWWKPEWTIVDLVCTFLFSVLVLGTTIKMLWDILEVLMESTPREVDAEALQQGLVREVDGVIAVHELHIWAITVGKVILACHVTIRPDADQEEVLQKVMHYCDSKYKISHVTIQVERSRPGDSIS